MVTFVINYADGTTTKKEGQPCFGSLKDEHGRWDKEDVEVESITYITPLNSSNHSMFMKKIKWYENHPLFGIPVDNVETRSRYLRITVNAYFPADLVLGSLSVARLLFGDNREGEQLMIRQAYEVFGDMDLAVMVTDMTDGVNMFRYREESIVPDFNISKAIEWYRDPKCNGTGIEEKYSTNKSFHSVKSALTGKSFNSFNYTLSKLSRTSFLEFFNYETQL